MERIILGIYILFLSQDINTFPAKKEETTEELPVFIPGKCPENQILYPVRGEWICDCGGGFLYYPPKETCYPIYRQGPCKFGSHLIIKPSNNVAECVTNPCKDGSVRYKGKCYVIGATDGPCAKPGVSGIILVNTTSLAVECIADEYDPLSLFNVPKNCPRGSKRDSNNECRENWNV